MSSWIKHQVNLSTGLNIIIGSWEPLEAPEQITWMEEMDVVINVSDSACASLALDGPSSHWFPILEHSHWPVSTLFGIFTVLDFCANGDSLNVFVHCHGGQCRSRAVVALWLMVCHRTTLENAQKALGLTDELERLFDLGRVTKHDLDVLRAVVHNDAVHLSDAIKQVDKSCELPDNL